MGRIPARQAALLVLAVATATIGGALASEHLFGLVPCNLCLWQRQPYYAGIPLALATALAPAGSRLQRAGLALLALLFAGSAGLGGYHAGVEWGVFQGPSDCGGGSAAGAGTVADFLKSLDQVRVVSCSEAAWRFLGLSLAGWNALISAALAALAAVAAVAALPGLRPDHSSRSAEATRA